MNSFGRKKDGPDKIFTKELAGMILILFATLTLVCLITRDAVFSSVGLAINAFLLGVFGYLAYIFDILLLAFGVCLVAGKRFPRLGKRGALTLVSLLILALLLHVIIVRKSVAADSFGKFVGATYDLGSGGIVTSSMGGALFAVITYLPVSLIGFAGTYAVLGVAFAFAVYFTALAFLGKRSGKSVKEKKSEPGRKIANDGIFDSAYDYPVAGAVPKADDGRPALFVRDEEFNLKTKREKAASERKNESLRILYPDRSDGSTGLGYGVSGSDAQLADDDDLKKKIEYIKTPRPIDAENLEKYERRSAAPIGSIGVSEPIKNTPPSMPPMFEHDDGESIQDESLGRRLHDYNRYSRIQESAGDPAAERMSGSAHPASVGRADNYLHSSENTDMHIAENNAEPPRSRVEGAFGASARRENLRGNEESQRIERRQGDLFSENLRGNEESQRTERRQGDLFSENLRGNEESQRTERRQGDLFSENLRGKDDNLRTAGRTDGGVQGSDDLTATNVPDLGSRRGNEIKDDDYEETPAAIVPPVSGEISRIAETEEKTKTDTDPSHDFTAKIGRKYMRPPIDLLKIYKQDINAPHEDHEERANIIMRTLAEFGVDVQVTGYVQGPAVTRYECSLPAGVSVKKIPGHADDLAMRLESEAGIRIEAPIPGKNLVGIEVPNKYRTTVGLRDIVESEEFARGKDGELMYALGKNIVGDAICDNLAKGPHYLVAGATGMGKSVCLNTILISLVCKYSPEELRIILVDPKQVEFTMYEHLPHLMFDEIVTGSAKAIATLQWAVDEMEARYLKLKDAKVRDLDDYNQYVASDTVPRIPKVVIIVDEVGDLMVDNAAKRELEIRIKKLTQKSRAAGIHLILATQRPSVNVITGVIKANLPSRIAFRVSSSVDSMTILDQQGAENLLDKGDMLFRDAKGKFVRVQGAFISTKEVEDVVGYIIDNNEAYFNNSAAESIAKAIEPQTDEVDDASDDVGEREVNVDKLFVDALRHVINSGSASISMLQRRFSVGYSKAGALIDQMERMGFVSPFDGSRARQVLLTKEEFEKKYGEF